MISVGYLNSITAQGGSDNDGGRGSTVHNGSVPTDAQADQSRGRPFDYESIDYLVEIKVRRKAYDPWIIEELKLDTNIGIAESVKKDFVYVNGFQHLLYVWNISKLIRDDYDFGFEDRKMPWTTDFDAGQIITKRTGYLYNSSSLIINTEGL